MPLQGLVGATFSSGFGTENKRKLIKHSCGYMRFEDIFDHSTSHRVR